MRGTEILVFSGNSKFVAISKKKIPVNPGIFSVSVLVCVCENIVCAGTKRTSPNWITFHLKGFLLITFHAKMAAYSSAAWQNIF